MQNAKSVNMPKDRVEAAIKRAQGKDMTNYEEILYEGYAPHGVAILVETATDNHVRTVANIKSHFNKGHGTLGNSGSVSFQFKKMGVFKLKPEGPQHRRSRTGVDRLRPGRNGRRHRGERRIRPCAASRFSTISEICRKPWKKKRSPRSPPKLNGFPSTTVELPEDQAQDVLKLVDKLEQDEDVQKVFHNLEIGARGRPRSTARYSAIIRTASMICSAFGLLK